MHVKLAIADVREITRADFGGLENGYLVTFPGNGFRDNLDDLSFLKDRANIHLHDLDSEGDHCWI